MYSFLIIYGYFSKYSKLFNISKTTKIYESVTFRINYLIVYLFDTKTYTGMIFYMMLLNQ